jgi:uncharacterized protein
MLACSVSSNSQAVQALLQGGADSCYQSRYDGISAIYLAAKMGYTDYCSALHTASSGRALELRGEGEGPCATPLISACAMEQHAVVKLLCTLGADVNHSSLTGSTPLMVAAAKEGFETTILHFLLQQHGVKVNHRDDNGDTALINAATSGNVAAVNLLHQHGADACVTDNTGYSPAFFAVREGHLQVLKLLTGTEAAHTARCGRNSYYRWWLYPTNAGFY